MEAAMTDLTAHLIYTGIVHFFAGVGIVFSIYFIADRLASWKVQKILDQR